MTCLRTLRGHDLVVLAYHFVEGCLRLHKVEDGTLSVDPLKLATRLVVA
jgi:hypothetical protein